MGKDPVVSINKILEILRTRCIYKKADFADNPGLRTLGLAFCTHPFTEIDVTICMANGKETEFE